MYISNSVKLCCSHPQCHMLIKIKLSSCSSAPCKQFAVGQTKYRPVDLDTVSLKMYWNVLRAFGGESVWRRLLHVLREVAERHQTTVACVAIQWVMSQGGGGVAFPIIGADISLIINAV